MISVVDTFNLELVFPAHSPVNRVGQFTQLHKYSNTKPRSQNKEARTIFFLLAPVQFINFRRQDNNPHPYLKTWSYGRGNWNLKIRKNRPNSTELTFGYGGKLLSKDKKT